MHKKFKSGFNVTVNQCILSDLDDFLNQCQAIGIMIHDLESTINNIRDLVIDEADENLPTRELKTPLLFLRELRDLFKGIKVRQVKQNLHTILSNSVEICLVSADLSDFFKSCRLIGINLNDLESMVHNIVEIVIDSVDQNLPTRELKHPLLFLRNLETLFRNLTMKNIGLQA